MADDTTYYLCPDIGDLVTVRISGALADEYAALTQTYKGSLGHAHGPLLRSMRYNLKKAGNTFDMAGFIDGMEDQYDVTLVTGETITLVATDRSYLSAKFPSLDTYLPGEPRVNFGDELRSGLINPIHFAQSLTLWDPEEHPPIVEEA